MPFFRLLTVLTASIALSACGGPEDMYFKDGSMLDQPEVDLGRYSGTWHEIARLPNSFESGCVRATAEYSVRADGKVSVLNTCYYKDNSKTAKPANGIARSLNSGNNRLKVRFAPAFIPFAEGDYWILKLDPDYRIVLVGSPSRRYLWILARDPALPRNALTSYLELAKALGYDTDGLYYTEQ